jgi:hypothetical protein
MPQYNNKPIRKFLNYLLVGGLLIGAGAGIGSYLGKRQQQIDESRFSGANVVTVPYRSGVPYWNFTNEGGDTALDWTSYMYKLKELNGGRDITQFAPNEPFNVFDFKDPKTGKPDGKVLPDSYVR